MREIIRDALSALRSSWLMFYFVPALLAIGVFIYLLLTGAEINLFNGIIETISIFAAFMFTLIFVIVDHFVKRKEVKISGNDEDKNYINRYRVFARDSVAMISFSIILAGVIIILQIIFPQIKSDSILVKASINFVLVFLLAQYAVLILLIIKEMYAMLTDDIESK